MLLVIRLYQVSEHSPGDRTDRNEQFLTRRIGLLGVLRHTTDNLDGLTDGLLAGAVSLALRGFDGGSVPAEEGTTPRLGGHTIIHR